MSGYQWFLVLMGFGWAIALLEFGVIYDQKRHIERLRQRKEANRG